MVTLQKRGHYERQSRSDLHNHKMNANIISIYNKKLLTYLHAEQNNRLFSLDKCMIWTSQKTVARKYKFSNIQNACIARPKLQLMHRMGWGCG